MPFHKARVQTVSEKTAMIANAIEVSVAMSSPHTSAQCLSHGRARGIEELLIPTAERSHRYARAAHANAKGAWKVPREPDINL
jgi:hypothetical protein